MLRTGLLMSVFALVASVASAQTNVNRTQWSKPVRVAVSVNLFVAAPTDASPQAVKAQEDARRKIYEIAGRECALLLEMMASDCRLENVNVNVSRYHHPPKPEGFNIRGNMSFRVTLK